MKSSTLRHLIPGLLALSAASCAAPKAPDSHTTSPAPAAVQDGGHILAHQIAVANANHFIVLPCDGAAAAGEAPLVYVIDEDHDLLSMLACDGKRIEFMKGALALDRVFRDRDGKSAKGEVHVAASVVGSKYSAFIGRLPDGGTALYLFDGSGMTAIFKFDFAAKKLVIIGAEPVKEAFR